MRDNDSFPTMMRKLTAGDADAAAAVFGLYANRLIGLARCRLEERVRSKVDPDDVAQSVFRTFFRRAAEGQFDLRGEDALWALLAEIAVRRCGKWNRHFRTCKRGPEIPSADADLAAALQPGPDEAATLADLVETLLRGLNERQRLICEMRLQGHAVAEIAAKTSSSPATVFRDLAEIKLRLETLLPPDAV